MQRAIAILMLFLVPSATVLNARVLNPDELPEEWPPLIEGLRDRMPLRAGFIETRSLPFRSKAVELSGTLRLDAEAGVSLHYPGEGESVTNLVDDSGLATRRDQQAWRPLPDRPEVRALHQAIAALLTLDLPSLDQVYSMDGTMDGEDWYLLLTPRPGTSTGRLEALSVAGLGESVTRIEASLGGDRGFVIEILNEETQVAFQPEEYALYFR